MVAHYFGFAKPEKQEAARVERLEDQSFLPVNAVPSAEFDAMLKSMGLPSGGE